MNKFYNVGVDNKGGKIMRETLNERIRKLRREKGLTQLQLSEQLNVTDKAVSKWEVGEGNPDISLLPKIAEIFDVTTDYLLTGVLPTESISIEDMDEDKRAIYLVQRDDVDNFIKFDYYRQNALINAPGSSSHRYSGNIDQIRNEIYKFESTKIFEIFLDDLKSSDRYTRQLNNAKSPATLIYNDIDNFIKMCAITNRVDGLEFINFPIFALGDKKDQKLYRNDDPTDFMQTYLIKDDTLRFIFEDDRVSEETINYVSKLHFLEDSRRNPNKNYNFMNDDLIYYMYKYNKHNLLEEAIKDMYKNLEYGVIKYNENVPSSRIGGADSRFVKNSMFYMFRNVYSSYGNDSWVVAVVDRIRRAFKEAENNLDIKWLEIFNNYNKEIALKLNEQSYYLNEKQMELLKMKSNPNINEHDILVYNYTKFGLLNIEKMLISLLPKEDNADFYKKVLVDSKKLFNDYIKNSYINYAEMIEDLVNKKDYKKIFEFAADYDLNELVDVMINKKYKEIMTVAKKLFYLDDKAKEFNEYIYTVNRNKDNPTKPDILYLNYINYPNRKEQNEKYILLLENQFNCYFNQHGNIKSFVKEYDNIKKIIYNSFVSKVENKIEEITGEQKTKAEYESLINELTENYFKSLLEKKQLETLVIKLSVKLEAKLRYIFKYQGELKEMLDLYIENQLKLENLYDDEDNRYYKARELDEIKTEHAKLLNQLRMVRNSIVHSVSKKEMLSIEELEKLIVVIEKVGKNYE